MKYVKILFFLLIYASSVIAQIDIPSEMVLIPGGEFIMGKNSNYYADFSPVHKVVLDSFLMDKHEVTNLEYKKFCDATGYKLPEFWDMDIFKCGDKYPDYPVIGINWYDAQKYAAWAGKRLPTEAEWEYAARGGLVDKNYPTGDTLGRIEDKTPSKVWVNRIVPAALYSPNAFGLYDMDGNVWEWISDRYDEQYYSISPQKNPTGPDKGTNRLIRGGSWHSGGMCKRVYFRKGLPSNWVDFAVGFRCAKSL